MWSLILGARDPQHARDALNRLMERYCRPVYWYIRTDCGRDATTSLDLTQEFFLYFMQTGFLDKVDADRGRFRNFLKRSVRNFVINTIREGAALRRGGARLHLPLDAIEDAGHLAAAREFGPEEIFEREWRAAIVRAATDAARQRLESDGRGASFEAFRLYDLDGAGAASYAAIAAHLGVSEDTVRSYLRTARQTFRECLLAEVRNTVESAQDVEDEMRRLFG
jgi:RNA polymerase sigma-70 factor (ECF subfamily)